MTSKKTGVYTKIDEELYEEYKKLSLLSNSNLAQLITDAIQKHNDEQNALIKENPYAKTLLEKRIEEQKKFEERKKKKKEYGEKKK